MIDKKIVSAMDIDEVQKRQMLEIYVDGFAYMYSFTKNRAKLIELAGSLIDFSKSYVCLCDGVVGGVLGLGTSDKRSFTVNEDVCRKLFGDVKGKALAKILRAMCEKQLVKSKTHLLIDYIATNSCLRGMGVATDLMEFALSLPEYNECYLDVLSKNTKAKSLYEKLGFEVYDKEHNVFLMLQGLGYFHLMKCSC